MYKGKKTLFYNGEKLVWEEASPRANRGEFLIYEKEERQTWEVIIVLPGVEVIPESTFLECYNVKAVIMNDTVRRIEDYAFYSCRKLVSANLEYIGRVAFYDCIDLTSISIPPSCREIDSQAFNGCKKLIILSVPQHTELGDDVIYGTKLIEVSPVEMNNERDHEDMNNETNDWIKNINNEEEYALHRACSSFNPLEEVIYEIVQREKSLDVFKKKNSIGITPSQYLDANPFAKVTEQKIINRFILEMTGEIFL